MAPSRRVRILIVDDSAVMRSLLRSVLRMQAGLKWRARPPTAQTALGAVEALHPDLVLLDVEMPVMDGLATLRKLRGRGHTHAGHHVQFAHPARRGGDHRSAGQRRFRLCCQAGQPGRSRRMPCAPWLASFFPRSRHSPPFRPPRSALANSMRAMQGPGAPQLPGTEPIVSIPSLLAIGVSTGGPAALDIVLPAFPATFPIPVLIVQHMPELFTRLLAERLNGRCPLAVREAAEGNPVQPGTIYIARGNWHLEIVSRSAHRAAANASPDPGPARESLPSCGRRPLSLGRCRLRLRRARRCPHRHGLRWPGRRPHHPRSRWNRAGPGSGHQRRLGHARRCRSPGRSGAARISRFRRSLRKSCASPPDPHGTRNELREAVAL